MSERAAIDRLVPLALGVAILAIACGSSSVGDVSDAARNGRWLALLAFCGVAVAAAVFTAPRSVPVPFGFGAGVLLAILAVVSSAWSIYPTLTLQRASTFAVAMAAAAAVAVYAAGRPERIRAVLGAVVAAAVVLAVAGFFVLLVDHGLAVQDATSDVSTRFRGFGQNANTLPMLYALALPAASWFAFRGRTQLGKGAAAVSALLLFGSILESGSRGATLASLGGVLLVAALLGRGWLRLPLVALVLVVYAGGVKIADLRGIDQELQATPAGFGESAVDRGVDEFGIPVTGFGGAAGPGTEPAPGPGEKAPARFRPAGHHGFDVYEFGRERREGAYFTPEPRGFFGGDRGRLLVWDTAIEQGRRRAPTGYGFGVEEQVFVDRSYDFGGSRPENSYIGLFMQLGLVGLALLASFLVALLLAFLRVFRAAFAGARDEAVVASAMVATGLVLALFQSYFYSVGNVATLTFWTACFLLLAGAGRVAPEPVAVPERRYTFPAAELESVAP